MNFLFPSTYAELRDHHFLDRYKVSTKNQVSKMDERLWLMRIHQLDEGFNQLDTIIQDPQYFDFFYHLIEHLDQHPNQKVQLQLIESFSFQIQKINPNRIQALQMTLFLLLNLMQQKNLQGNQLKKALKTLIALFDQPIITHIGREGSRYFFDIVKIVQEIKDNQIRELWIALLMRSLITWPQYDHSLKNRVVHLMYEQENVVTSIARFLAACYRDERTRAYANDQLTLIVNYITEKSTNQTDSIAVKNLREVLSMTSKEIPRYYQQQLSALIGLYDNENYHIRNALTDVITSVIEYLVREQDVEETQTSNIHKLIKSIIDRHQDKTALCRSNVLQCLANLVVSNCIPKGLLQTTFAVASSRLRDVSGYVRKAALQLLKSIVKYYRMMFVQSQGRETFWTPEEARQLLQKNTLDLDQIKEEFQELDKQFQEKQILSEELKSLKRRAQETTKVQDCLEEYEKFVSSMGIVINQVLQLCQSKNQGDVIHSIKLFAYLRKFSFPNNQIGIKRMLLLVWSQDKSIQSEVLKKFHKLFIRVEKVSIIIDTLLEFIMNSNLKELISLEKILNTYDSDSYPLKLPAKLFPKLWETLNAKDTNLRAVLILIRILVTKQPALLTNEKVNQLTQILLRFSSQSPDWAAIKELAVILSRNNTQTQKSIGHLTALLIKHQGTEDMTYFGAIDAIIQLISGSEKWETTFELILQDMAYDPQRMEEESSVEQELFLSHSIYVAGTIALQLLIHVDNIHNELKVLKNQKEKEVKEQEIDKIQGGLEAEFERMHEHLIHLQNKCFLQQNQLAHFAPLVKDLISKVLDESTGGISHSPLVQVSLITMCKFMCLSESYCSENLPLLFQIMKSSCVDQVMKNNVIISIGDLLHRWPNTVQKFHKQIYSNLSDPSPTVRRVTLLVLTHLILNDMIKSKASLQHIPQLLVDPHPQIPPMARYFLNELSKKEQRAISNAIADITQNVQEQNENILSQVSQYIDKTQIDSIVDRLITNMSRSDSLFEVRNIAFLFSLMNLGQQTLQKFLDGFEEYRLKLDDEYVNAQFLSMIKKFRRSLPQEAKPMIDEFEAKVEHHDKETFDGRRRDKEKASKRKAQVDQSAKENQNQPQQTQPQKLKKALRRKPKQMELESSEEEIEVEEDSEPEVIKKQAHSLYFRPKKRRGQPTAVDD